MAQQRTRRKKPPTAKRLPAAGRSAPTVEQICGDLFAEILRSAQELLDVDDPLEAELWASGLLGTWSAVPLIDADPDELFGGGLVRWAGRRARPASLALLLAVAAVAPPKLAAEAGAAAARLRSGGVAAPAWGEAVGRAAFTEAWRRGDRYGDQDMLVVGFAYPRPGRGRAHSLAVLIDHNLGGIAKDAFVAAPQAQVAAAVPRPPGRDGHMVEESLDAAGTAARLAPALQASDLYVDAPLSADFHEARALVHARLRTLPEPSPVARPDVDRAALVDDFLAAPESRRLPPTDDTAFLASCLVDFRCDGGDGLPLRWSPSQVELCLLDWFPRKVSADPATLAAAPDVLRAWVRYAGRRSGLPARLLSDTLAWVGELRPQFLEAIADPSRHGPAKALAMAMHAEGIDLADDAAVQRWVAGYNARLAADRVSVSR